MAQQIFHSSFNNSSKLSVPELTFDIRRDVQRQDGSAQSHQKTWHLKHICHIACDESSTRAIFFICRIKANTSGPESSKAAVDKGGYRGDRAFTNWLLLAFLCLRNIEKFSNDRSQLIRARCLLRKCFYTLFLTATYLAIKTHYASNVCLR